MKNEMLKNEDLWIELLSEPVLKIILEEINTEVNVNPVLTEKLV